MKCKQCKQEYLKGIEKGMEIAKQKFEEEFNEKIKLLIQEIKQIPTPRI